MNYVTDNNYDNTIAIIGAAGEFPGAENLHFFWKNLIQGNELIAFFSDEDLLKEGVDPSLLGNPNYIKAKGFLENIECFDADFFGYSAREAELIDPQQRHLLQWAWSALEVAGYDVEQYQGSIGVFACSSLSSYLYFNILPSFNSLLKMQDEMLMVMGNEKDFIATRISYKMNLKGPSKSIQTACSSSLVAVHDACQNLLNYECDMALAGGVSITFPVKNGYLYAKEGIVSADGHCRAFDHQATGTVSGNGGGIVVLKRLQDAIQDGDTIVALIRGSCVNNDGADKVGYTAPSIKGQASAIVGAHLSAAVDPSTITYVECHGTGTILGDPIEVAALTAAFQAQAPMRQKQFCALGSVKTNIGHLDAAAGIAGLLKTALSIQQGLIPPSLNFEQGNPKIPFENSPFYVNTQLRPWCVSDHPRRAGVSSFGIGGTNAHVILEEPPTQKGAPTQHTSFLFPFSAKTKAGLKRMLAQFLDFLFQTKLLLADIMYTLQIGRRLFEHRVCFVCASIDELKRMIEHYLKYEIPPPINRESSWSGTALCFLKGENISWQTHYCQEKRCRVPLPTYPFAKNKYIISPKTTSSFAALAYPNKPTGQQVKEILKNIWESALKIASIDVDDNFFEIGGDSLIALEITDGIRTQFRLDINLQHIFDYPTIAALERVIKQEIGNKIDDNC